MEGWWTSLSTELQVFWAIALGTTVALGVQMLMLLFGFDGDADADFDVDVDGDGGAHVFSVRSVTAFFTGFGWTGVVALQADQPLLVAIVLALVVGAAFMFGVVALMRGLYAMRASGTLDLANAVGQVATVYVRVPGNSGGPGQVEVMIQGRLQVLTAMTETARDLPPRSKVRVTGLVDPSTLRVEPLNGAREEA